MINKDYGKRLVGIGIAGAMTFTMFSGVPAFAITNNETGLETVFLNQGTRNIKTDYQALRQQWFQELIGVNEANKNNTFIQANIKSADEEAKVIYESMNSIESSTECLWNDLDANKYGAKMTAQFERLLKLAKVYQTPGSAYYKNEELKNKLIEGVAFVNDHFYSTPKDEIHSQGSGKNNWWDWEIGTPTHVANLLIALYDVLPEETRNGLISNIDVYTPNITNRTLFWPTVTETGANRADKALILTLRGIAGESAEKLAHVRDNLPNIFDYVKSGDGFYKDGSFIQHSNVAYTGAYGYVLLDSAVNILSILQKTEQAIADKDYENLYSFVRDSFIPALSLGGNNMDMVRGRSASRESWQSNRTGKQIMSALIQLADVAPENEKQFIEGVCKTLIQEGIKGQDDYYKYITNADISRISELLNNNSVQEVKRTEGFYALNNMERAIAQRDEFTFGVSMSSSRISNYESGNNENLKGWYMGQGVTYFYTSDTQQYNKDYWPTVDQLRLPGVTSDGLTRKDGATKSAFATSNTIDNCNGTSVMVLSPDSLTSTSERTGLSANKSWFVMGDAIVALGSGISSEREVDVETIIDNHRIEGEKALVADGKNISLEDGKEKEISAKWLHLQGNVEGSDIGYVVLDNKNINLKKETNTAPWSTINQLPEFMTEDDKTNTFISLAVDHGNSPENEGYAYAVYPGKSIEETKKAYENSDIEILANTNTVQAVHSKSLNMTVYNFFKAGSLNGISVDGAASVIVKKDGKDTTYSVNSLDRSGKKITLTFADMNADQVSVDNENANIIQTSPLSIEIKPGTDGSVVKFTIKNEPASQVVGDNLAKNKSATASSTETTDGRFTADKAIDGDTESRWSAGKDNEEEHLTVDLGEVKDINRLRIQWGDAFASKYKILVSEDGKEFVEVYATDKGNGGIETLDFETVKARYVRYEQLARWNHPTNGKQYGTSIFELEVYNVRHRQNVKDAVSEADKFFEDYTIEDIIAPYYDEVKKAYDIAQEILSNPDFNQVDANNAANNLKESLESAKENIVIKVEKLVPSFTEVELAPQENKKVEVSYQPENATYKDLVFSSADEKVASVNEEGLITANGTGEALITITSVKHNISATVTVKVKEDKSKLEVIIDKAENIDSEKYTEESYSKLEEAINSAKEIMNKEYANKEEIEEAIKSVDSAINDLKEIEDEKQGSEETPDKETTDKPEVDQENKPNKEESNSEKTGDVSTIPGLIGLLLGSAGIGFITKRKNRK